jgi:hypothetical protein
MRGLRRAYDPHLAARRLASAASFAFGLGLGQYPSLRGGAKWGMTPPSGSCLGAQWGCTLLLPGGLSRELHACPASAGNILGCGLRVLGVVCPSGARAGLGRRLSAQYSLSFSCLRFARAGLITARKGDVRAVISLPILHVYTRRLYSFCMVCRGLRSSTA